MDCNQTRAFILTDYIDNNLDEKTAAEVKSHIDHCDACREFEKNVLSASRLPFAKAVLTDLPEHLWEGIRKSIEADSQPWYVRIREFFQMALLSRRTVAAVCILMMVTAGVIIVRTMKGTQDPVSGYGEDTIQFLNGLETSLNDYDEYSTVDFGTAIEEYFL